MADLADRGLVGAAGIGALLLIVVAGVRRHRRPALPVLAPPHPDGGVLKARETKPGVDLGRPTAACLLYLPRRLMLAVKLPNRARAEQCQRCARERPAARADRPAAQALGTRGKARHKRRDQGVKRTLWCTKSWR